MNRWVKLVGIMLLLSMLAGGWSLSHKPSGVLASTDVDRTYVHLGGGRIQHASPAVADFNGDGDLEIVVGAYDGMLYVIAYSGSGWSVVWSRQTALDINAANPPTPQASGRIESAPAVADMDNDGDLEIVVTTGGLPANHLNGGVLVYGYQGSTPGWSFAIQGNWPQPKQDIVGGETGASKPDGYWDGIYASPAVGDLDGDGDLEIAVEGEDRAIHAWHHTGTYVSGWPFTRSAGDPILRGGLSSPALGDLDNDGLPEVVVGGLSPMWDGIGSPDYTYAAVWAINGDSSLVPGWPQYAREWVDSSPALGDIDGDGELEVVVGTGRDGISAGDQAGYYVYAWNADGTPVSGWPRPTGANMGSSPALADLDQDGVLDVIIGCGYEAVSSCHYLYAWHGNGTNVSGFPMEPLDVNPWGHISQVQPYPPVIADIDGNNYLEILLVMSNSNGVSVVNHNGTMNTDYSRFQDQDTNYTGMIAPPVVADVDNDGFLETIGAGAGQNTQAAIYIWEEVGPASGEQPWPMFHHDVQRTGRYPSSPILGFPAQLRFLHQQGSGTSAEQYAILQNLGEGTMDWSISHSITGLQVTPASGTVSAQATIKFTLDTTGRPAGWSNLGNLSVSGMVNGSHVQSSPQTIPVRLYIGDVERIYLPILVRGR